jgi:hypothetical protein
MGSGGTQWEALDTLSKERLNQKTTYVGPSAPGTTYAGQFWYDTTEKKLKQRNTANTSWFDYSLEKLPASYTIYQDATYCYAVANFEGGTNYVNVIANAKTTFQSAVTALAAKGGKIFIRQGRYYLNDTITIATEGIVLEGESTCYDMFGTTLEFTNGTTNKPMFKYDYAGHRYFGAIKNMQLNGSQETGSIAIDIVQGFSDIWFEKLFIQDFETAGIKIEANGNKVWNIWILDCLIEEIGTLGGSGYGVWMTNATDIIDRVTIRGGHYYGNKNTVRIDNEAVHNILITDITVEKERQTSLYLADGRNIIVTNNRIFDCGTDAANIYDGVYIGGSGGNPAVNVVITGNRIGNHWTSNQRYNINLGGACDHVTIRANNLTGYGTAAILKNTSGTDLDIVGNRGWADTKEIFFPVTFSSSGIGQWDGHPVANIDTGSEVASIGVVLPADFKVLQSAEFLYIPIETAASQHLSINTYWGKVGEQRGNHSESSSNFDLGATVSGQLASYSVAYLLDVAALEPGDIIGFYCEFSATVVDTNINVLGIRIKYEPIEN